MPFEVGCWARCAAPQPRNPQKNNVVIPTVVRLITIKVGLPDFTSTNKSVGAISQLTDSNQHVGSEKAS